MSNGSKPLVFRLNDRGQGPDLVRQVFLERGWVEYDEDTQHESDWNIWWRTSRFRLSDYDNILSWQRLNHYPKSTGITKKDCLVRNMKRMKGVHGAGVFNFSPLSFNLPNDYTRYVAEYGKLKTKIDPKLFAWICKPADMSRGRGIFVFKDINELQYDCNAVVQQYIANPLLIGGYKFDIRIYVAVPSFHPLTVYIFEEGIVRFGTEKFDMSSLQNVFAHLTNTSINKHSPSYTADKDRIGPGCKWTITQLRYYLHQNNIDDRMLWAKITNIIILTILVQAPQVPKEKNCCELYGFDILIDDCMKPWLLEVNFSPALSTDCQCDILVKKPMLHNLMDMLNFTDHDAERGGLNKMDDTTKGLSRGRMASASKARPDPIDRTTSSSRLSQRGNIQRMSSNISSLYKSIDAPVIEQTLSFIEQDTPYIHKTNEEKLCFGLPLVHPSDDEKYDSDCQSVKSSTRSEANNHERSTSRCGKYTPVSLVGQFPPMLERGIGSFDRSGTISSIVKKPESLHSYNQRGDKTSLKSFGNSDSAYSSFSDNSEKGFGSSNGAKSKIYNRRRKTYTLQSEILSEIPKENSAFQIKSLRPNENSNSLKKVSNRGKTAVEPITKKSSVNSLTDRSVSRSFDRASSRNYVRSQSRYGNSTARSDVDSTKPSRSQVVSRLSSIPRPSREKELINLGLTGMTKKPTTLTKNKSKTKAAPSQYKPKGPPPSVGDFFLVFPFNEGTLKTANSTLDPHIIIKETQRRIKDMKAEIDKNPDDKKIGGHLPYGAAADADRLWAPVKPLPTEES